MSLSLPRPPAWVADAKCADTDNAEAFFGTAGHPAYAREHARQLCGGCPVIGDCLTYALTFGPTLEGIWGGLGAEDRREILNRRQAS